MPYKLEQWTGKPETWDADTIGGSSLTSQDAREMSNAAEVAYQREYGRRPVEIHLISTRTPGRYFMASTRWEYIRRFPKNITVFYVVANGGASPEGWAYHADIQRCALDYLPGLRRIDTASLLHPMQSLPH